MIVSLVMFTCMTQTAVKPAFWYIDYADKKQGALSVQARKVAIYEVRRDGSKIKLGFPNGDVDFSLQWFPSISSLVYKVHDGQASSIRARRWPFQGTTETRLSSHWGNISPDRRFIIQNDSPDGHNDTFKLDVIGAKDGKLKNTITLDQLKRASKKATPMGGWIMTRWSPDSTKIAFTLFGKKAVGPAEADPETLLYVYNVRTKKLKFVMRAKNAVWVTNNKLAITASKWEVEKPSNKIEGYTGLPIYCRIVDLTGRALSKIQRGREILAYSASKRSYIVLSSPNITQAILREYDATSWKAKGKPVALKTNWYLQEDFMSEAVAAP